MSWEDLLFTSVGPRYREFEWKCDCVSVSKDRDNSALKLTTVNREGICDQCGHYAIRTPVFNWIKQINELREKGYGYLKIARILGIAENNVRYHIDKERNSSGKRNRIV